MLHHFGLGKEWAREREVVASLMQHNNGTTLNVGGRDVASEAEWSMEQKVTER
jgi:hypothetical protein